MASELPQSLPVALIVMGPRLRPVDPAAVQNMQVAIEESGFFGAILVRPILCEEGEQRFELVAGAHRLAAMRALGRPTIPAVVRNLTDDEARQIEIDENLVRRSLTPLERAEMLEARFAVWSRRFPGRVVLEEGDVQRKRGRPKKEVNLTQFTGGAPQTMGFAVDTAEEVGLSESTVKRAWTTVNGLAPALRAKLHGTWIARNDSVLRQLASLPEADKAPVIDILLQGETRSVSDALAKASGVAPSTPTRTPVDEALKAFKAIWGKASPAAREAILHELAGRPLPGEWVVAAGPAPGLDAGDALLQLRAGDLISKGGAMTFRLLEAISPSAAQGGEAIPAFRAQPILNGKDHGKPTRVALSDIRAVLPRPAHG